MAQIITARLSRNDAQPWGFRLQGGKDFGTPLVIQKVNTGSIADKAGLQAGDAVVRVNEADLYNLRHKDAQDAIVRAGTSFELIVQRGATWKPTVTPLPNISPSMGSHIQPVTKTSLAANPQQLPPSPVRSITSKQYNSPVGMYSDQSIAESLSAQAEVLAGGVLGVNFKKNEKVYNPEKSEVLKMLQENESDPEPEESLSAAHSQYSPSQTQQQQQHQHYVANQQQQQQQQQQNCVANNQQQQNFVANNNQQQQQQQPPQQQQVQQPQTQNVVTKHVYAPVDRPIAQNNGLPAGQNICANCERLIVGVFVRIKDKNLHQECFKCATCGTSLKNQGYYNLHNKLYCDIHARLAALNSPPPNATANGLVPVTLPPKNMGASTISSALNAHAGNMNGNGNGNGNNNNSCPELTKIKLNTKVNDDNNNNFYDTRSNCSTSETDCSSLSSSDKENDSRPSSSLYGSIKPESQKKNINENFQYKTLNGAVVKSVVPPGKGIKVDYYKVPNMAGPKPFSYTQAPQSMAGPPMAAPKSPSSYPPAQPAWAPSAVNAAPKPIGQQNVQGYGNGVSNFNNKPSGFSPKSPGLSPKSTGFSPKSVAFSPASFSPKSPGFSPNSQEDYDEDYYYVEDKVKEKRIEIYVPDEESEEEFDPKDLVNISRPPPSNFIWPPLCEIEKVPIAAPLYTQPPETQHVTVRPCTRPFENPSSRLSAQNLIKVESQQTTDTMDSVTEYVCCAGMDSNNSNTCITATTTSTTSNASSESEYKMYQTQNNQYANMFDTSCKDDDHEILEINNSKITDLRVTPPPPELPKTIKHVEFVEPEASYKAETYSNVFSSRKETWQKLTGSNTKKDEKIKPIQQPVVELNDDEEDDVEAELIQGQHCGPNEGSYYQLAPSNIPQPTPKLYQSEMQKALIYSSERPYHISDVAPTPEPKIPNIDMYEAAIREAQLEELLKRDEPEEAKNRQRRETPKFEVKTTKKACDFPLANQQPRKGTLMSTMARTASPKPIEFMRTNIIEPVDLPDDSDAYFPPPISMEPKPKMVSMESYRTKSPFVAALTTVPDRPFTPFGQEIMSQLVLELPANYLKKSTMTNALKTAPEESFDPSSMEYEYDPTEYTAKVYERINQEADADESFDNQSAFVQIGSLTRSFLPSIQPWSSHSDQPAANNYTDAMSGQTDCKVSTSCHCKHAECCQQQEEVVEPEKPVHQPLYPKRNSQPSPFEGLQVKVGNKMTNALHKPDDIPNYQRKWFNLPTQNPGRTPEPDELRDNVPLAFTGQSGSNSNSRRNSLSKADQSCKHDEQEDMFEDFPSEMRFPSRNVAFRGADGVGISRRNSAVAIQADVNTRRASAQATMEPANTSRRGSVVAMPQVESRRASAQGIVESNPSRRTSVVSFPTSRNVMQHSMIDEDADEYTEEYHFPTQPKLTESGFPNRGVRKNSLADLPQRQKQQFDKQRELRQELSSHQNKMQQKQKNRQQRELEMMQLDHFQGHEQEEFEYQTSQKQTVQTAIQEESYEYQENPLMSSYEQEQEYKRQQDELEETQKVKEQELRAQKTREQEYQKEMEDIRAAENKIRVKREKEMREQTQREIEYRTLREIQDAEMRRKQAVIDAEMERQQKAMEDEIHRRQELERREKEEAERKRVEEIKRKEEHDIELARIEAILRENREIELKKLEEEIRERREQQAREIREAEAKIRRDQKANEENAREHKRLEVQAKIESKDQETRLQKELKMRHKQEADRKQREEFELFNVAEERSRTERLSRPSSSMYASVTNQQQTVWPPSKPPTPALVLPARQVPVIRADSESELNGSKFRFEPLDEQQRSFMAGIRPPSTCYSPPTEEKPFPSIPYYQQHLAFYEAEPEHAGIFNPKACSPVPNRSRSPAFGPPPNPMRAFVPKCRDPNLDESGIYLCGGLLLSPVWYDKQEKQLPPGVQKKNLQGASRPPSKPDFEALHRIAHERKVHNLINSRPSSPAIRTTTNDTKAAPIPPPMPPTTPQVQLRQKRSIAEDGECQQIESKDGLPPKATNKVNKDINLPTDLLKESVDRLNINTSNTDFRKNASSVLAAMLEARMTKQQMPQVNNIGIPNKIPTIKRDPEFIPPPPPPLSPPYNKMSTAQIYRNCSIDEDMPLPPPPPPPTFHKIPMSNLTPPMSSDENEFIISPQKNPTTTTNSPSDNNIEKVNYRNKKNLTNINQSSEIHGNGNGHSTFSLNKPELSTHARDRRSYIEKNNNDVPSVVNGGGQINSNEVTATKIANGLANGEHPVCDKCKCKITRGPFITALGKIWCPDHFVCVNGNCKRELADIGFVEEKGDLYCEYCFEQFLAPPCSKCNGKIKGDCLNAIGKKFHPECFKCTYCGKLFGNSPFFLEEGEAYCEADWNELFTTKCFACGFPVEAGDRWVEALNNNYHSQCFNCTYCKKNLEGQSFFAKGGRPFCKAHAR